MHRVFLTGVAGILGGLLADQLSRLPDVECVTGIDVVEPAKPLPPHVQFVKMDIRSPQVAKIMAGHDTVVHAAIIMLWSAQMPSQVRRDINVNGAASVARAAVANRIERFIYTSSTAAYDIPLLGDKIGIAEDIPLGRGTSNSYYCNDKAAAERAVTEILGPTPTRLIILRPCGIGGPSFGRTARLLRDTASRRRGAEPRGQVVDEEDVVAAYVLALRNGMVGAYNVVPDDYIHMKEVVKITGARQAWMPTIAAIWLKRIAWKYLRSPIHPSWVTASTTYFVMSNEKLKAAGWTPKFGSAQALQRASS